jgi:hypothetical protein
LSKTSLENLVLACNDSHVPIPWECDAGLFSGMPHSQVETGT